MIAFSKLVRVMPILALCLAPLAPCNAQDDPVVRGRNAFAEQGDWSWYDGNTDSLRPISPPPVPQGGRRGGKGGGGKNGGEWRPGGGGTGGGGRRGNSPVFNSAPSLGGAGMALNGIAWVLIGIILVAVIAGIIYAIIKLDLSKDDDEDEEDEESEEVELSPAEKLPFDVDRSIGDFLDAAKNAYVKQDYRMAMIYLFSHTLLTLDQNQWIRLTRGKTNRQYLAELRSNRELQRYFEQVMIPFEAAFFGDIPISRQQFEHCWQQTDRFHQMVRRSPVNPQMQPLMA